MLIPYYKPPKRLTPLFSFRRLQQKWNTPAETCFYSIREYAAIATPQPAAPDEIGFVIYIERKFKNGFYFCTFRGILWVSGAGGYGAVIRQAAFFCNNCMSREAARNIRSQGSASFLFSFSFFSSMATIRHISSPLCTSMKRFSSVLATLAYLPK